MTRQEAIKRLKEYAQYSYGIYHNGEEDGIAFDMAIEALEQEPIIRCEDCEYSRVYALDSNEEPRRWCVRGLVKAVDDDDFCSKGEHKESEEE